MNGTGLSISPSLARVNLDDDKELEHHTHTNAHSALNTAVTSVCVRMRSTRKKHPDTLTARYLGGVLTGCPPARPRF